jgi:hypothetical protein
VASPYNVPESIKGPYHHYLFQIIASLEGINREELRNNRLALRRQGSKHNDDKFVKLVETILNILFYFLQALFSLVARNLKN